MKTQIISAISASLFSLMVVNSASAQQPKTRVLPQVTITSPNTVVPERVVKNFNSSYQDASNIRWIELNKKFIVNFDQNDMTHKALYMKGGFQIYHVGYGFEKNLPSDILNLVNSKYEGFEINRVFNVDQDYRQMWIVNLMTSKSLITLRIENGIIEEFHRASNASVSDPLTTMIKK